MGSSILGTAGVNFSQKDATAQFPLGMVVQDTSPAGGSWAYIECGHALDAYKPYKRLAYGVVGSAAAADDAVDSNAASFLGGFGVCWPQQAFTAGEFGWVKLSGEIESYIATGLSAGDKLYTSATVGVLAATAASNFSIIPDAVVVDANSSGSDAVRTIYVTGVEPFLSPTAGV